MNMYLHDDYLNLIFWWVDASYGTHWEFDSNIGEVMLMGSGEIMSFSRKKKLNTGSSKEAELVGVADALGLMMWEKYFMEAQGYNNDSNILLQDNHSTIMIANNGKSLARNNCKHIKNRDFLIIDKIHQEDL